MSTWADLKMYGRFAWGLRGFLRHTITLEESEEIVKKRMKEREKNFLCLLIKGIFGYPKSPYLPLLKYARCELSDIENMVRSKGVEGTLLALREAGVYVSFEEFKGREPIVRNGNVIPVKPHNFDNPYLKHYYDMQTGGTTGAGTRVEMDLDHLSAQTPDVMLAFHSYGVIHAPTALWFGVLPDAASINNLLYGARLGNIPQKWFSHLMAQDMRPSLKRRLAMDSFLFIGRINGVLFPRPEPVTVDQASTVARWMADMLTSHGACLLRTTVSRAMRVSIAAQKEGLDLTGATFFGGGEPPTPAKVKTITQTGAFYSPAYVFTEAGFIGLGCAQPVDGTDLHFLKGDFALIQYPRQVPGSSFNVEAFLFTSLLPSAPKIMLNVESDDYGIMETRSCGCPLERYGFKEHLRQIFSFQKLTGEGVTLVGTEMIRILEEVLPARFGGGPLDYQLLEEEDEDGFTRLSLLVNPTIGIVDERAIIETILEMLGKGSVSADSARAIWQQAKTLRVKRMAPLYTGRGKLLPLYLVKHSHPIPKVGA